MHPDELAVYPFLNEASDYIHSLDLPPETLLTSKAFEKARIRGFMRLKDSLKDSFKEDVFKPVSFKSDQEALTELLSYLYARILVSCLNEPVFIRKFAFSEARSIYNHMKSDHNNIRKNIQIISDDIGIVLKETDTNLQIHFVNYIRYSLPLHDISWNIVNRRIESGFVTVSSDNLLRIIREAIRLKIEQSLPVYVPENICALCSDDLEKLAALFEEFRKNLKEDNFGEVRPDMFPPCIHKALIDVKNGINLAHSMRFALVSFLLNIGMTQNDVINIFNVSPDFDSDKTAYQVNHIFKNEYKCPSCSTMVTYGNCFGRDETCENIHHPLLYYSRKISLSKNVSEQSKNE